MINGINHSFTKNKEKEELCMIGGLWYNQEHTKRRFLHGKGEDAVGVHILRV